ncbi:unnamed protein product [Allacma fusca]|uniref:Uncharacterized protein n=1 Tax=Allacma fusca TaxID=39272 RepID=A0A8J2LQ55_9HEXA|nr:unnamed protein product [Allacma fusca]
MPRSGLGYECRVYANACDLTLLIPLKEKLWGCVFTRRSAPFSIRLDAFLKQTFFQAKLKQISIRSKFQHNHQISGVLFRTSESKITGAESRNYTLSE